MSSVARAQLSCSDRPDAFSGLNPVTHLTEVFGNSIGRTGFNDTYDYIVSRDRDRTLTDGTADSCAAGRWRW